MSPELESCLESAYRLLHYRSRSQVELRRRLLAKGFTARAIDEALAKLSEQGLIDDLAFARFWRESRENFSPRSRWLIEQELRQKGIDLEIAASVTQDLDEAESAYRAGKKKARNLSSVDYQDFKLKLGGFLRRRGFPWVLCHSTLDRLWQEQSH